MYEQNLHITWSMGLYYPHHSATYTCGGGKREEQFVNHALDHRDCHWRLFTLHEDWCPGSRYQGQWQVITSPWDVITSPCTWYLLPEHRSSQIRWHDLIDSETFTHWSLNIMAVILQATYSNVFSWQKSLLIWWNFHWGLFLRDQLAIIHHWYR